MRSLATLPFNKTKAPANGTLDVRACRRSILSSRLYPTYAVLVDVLNGDVVSSFRGSASAARNVI